jgi:serine/threonine-protein kinase
VDVEIGTIIAGRYRVVGELGRGGMGVVYRVEHVATGAQLALKMLLGDIAANEKLRERFTREAQVSARIGNQHVVNVSDAGADSRGSLFLVMELLDGATLEDALAASGPIEAGVVLRILEEAAHALAAAHAVGVFHRDIKPANIFLARRKGVTNDVIVKLLDFGIAKIMEDDSAQKSTVQAGSIAWAPPEQWNPQCTPAPTIDVWPLGLLAFSMLSGSAYWESENETTKSTSPGVMIEVLAKPLAAPSERARAIRAAFTDFSPAFDAWFLRCLAREPADRFASPEAAIAALSEALAVASAAIPLTLLPPARADGGPSKASGDRDGKGHYRGSSTVIPVSRPAMPAASLPPDPPSEADAPQRPSPASTPASPSMRPGTADETRVKKSHSRKAPWAIALATAALLVGTGAAFVLRSRGTSDTQHPAAPSVAHAPEAGDASADDQAKVAETPPLRWKRANVLEAIRSRGVLRVAVENEAPPLNMGVDGPSLANGTRTWAGFDHDVLEAVAKELGPAIGAKALAIEAHVGDLDDLERLVANDEADIVMGGQVPRKSETLSWSDPYLEFGHCLIAKVGSDVRTRRELADGRVVGVYKGDAKAERVARAELPAAKLVFAEGTGWMKPLAEGTWDAALYDFPFAVEELAAPGFEALRIIEMNLSESQYVIGVPSGNVDLVKALNAAIGRAFGRSRTDRTYAELLKRYFARSSHLTEDQLPPGQRVHVLRKGETLESVAARELGDRKRAGALWAANRGRFANRQLLTAGDRLILPSDVRE